MQPDGHCHLSLPPEPPEDECISNCRRHLEVTYALNPELPYRFSKDP